MKRAFSIFLALLLLICIAGCASNEPISTQTTAGPIQNSTTAPVPTGSIQETHSAGVITQKTMTAVSVPLHTQNTNAENGTVLFTYTYPSMSLMLQDAEVADKVILDFLNRVDATSTTALTLQKSAESAYTGSAAWNPYLCRVLYEPMRLDMSVLSLFGAVSTYSGGMHPEHTNVSANYDLLTGDVLTLGSIMHKDATMQMFCDLVLEQLDTVKDDRHLYSDYKIAVNKRFSGDESKDEDFYFTPEGLCFYFSPYQIAPYSSGTVVAEIPYEKLVGVIHDNYFPPEQLLTGGTVDIVPYKNANMETIHQIGEAVLTPGGEMYLLTASNAVNNVRLRISGDDSQNHEYVFFAASTLAPNSGIMLEVSDQELDAISVSYDNADGKQIFPLFN